jgi:hypothetical protein
MMTTQEYDMPTDTHDTYDDALVQRMIYNGTVYDTTNRTRVKREVIRYNEIEHREMPPKPLWRHPTGQPRQSTALCLLGTLKKYQEYSWGSLTSYVHVLPPDGAIFANAPNTFIGTRFRNKVRNDYVNLAVVLAEYPETVGTWNNALNAVLDMWKHAKHRKFPRSYCPPRKRGRRATVGRWGKCWFQGDWCSLVANTVLTDSYAIAPLVADVENSITHLADRLNKPVINRLVVTASTEVDDTETNDYWKQELYVSERVIAYLQHHTRMGVDINNMGFGNPAEWLWEMTPYSFVVDWFIGVGSWLQSLDALHGTTVLAATTTKKIRSVYTLRGEGRLAYPDYHVDNPGYGLVETHERNTLIPPIDSRPEWVASFAWYKVKNGLALAYQQIRNIIDSNKRHCGTESKSKSS